MHDKNHPNEINYLSDCSIDNKYQLIYTQRHSAPPASHGIARQPDRPTGAIVLEEVGLFFFFSTPHQSPVNDCILTPRWLSVKPVTLAGLPKRLGLPHFLRLQSNVRNRFNQDTSPKPRPSWRDRYEGRLAASWAFLKQRSEMKVGG